MKNWIVTGTSMVVEAETEEEAVERAEQSSGWHWEAREQSDIPDRLRDSCGCGMDIVWTAYGWQHDCAPVFHGDDHDVDTPDPDPDNPARKHWDIEDGVRDEDEWVCPGCDRRIQPSDVRRHVSECKHYDGSAGY